MHPHSAWRRPHWLIVAAVLVPLGFALATNAAWEDYFITLRSADNLVAGNGLVFTAGERVHAFTSPLGVLGLALGAWIAGVGHAFGTLWVFRVLNALVLGATCRLLLRRAGTLRLGAWGLATMAGLVLADPKLIGFATNGMETGFLVFFLVLLWGELEAPAGPRAWTVALAVGGLMWTRPDAFVLGGAVILPHFVFRPRGEELWRSRPLWRGIALGGLLYLPWLAWAWHYYGSPIPNTIIAKRALLGPLPGLWPLVRLPWEVLSGDSVVAQLLLPSYAIHGDWPAVFFGFARLLAIGAFFGWLIPAIPAAARRLSLAVFLGSLYLSLIVPYPWYLPPWAVLLALFWAITVDRAHAVATAGARPGWAAVVRVGCAMALAVQLGIFVTVAWQWRVGQIFVGERMMRPIGEWLRAHADPGDTLFLEPLGYVGYYSNLKTYDYPGLGSPEVVAAIREGDRSYPALIARLKPTWVLLRPVEATQPEFGTSHVLRQYEMVKTWNTFPDIEAIPLLPGRTSIYSGSQFMLFRRRPDASPAPPQS